VGRHRRLHPDGRATPIYLIELATGVTREIARLDHWFNAVGGHLAGNLGRGQPHPVWAPDSRTIVVNYNHAGDHMGLVLLHAP
jgi:hypothetical protein